MVKMFEAYITTKHGELVAEFGNLEAYLSDIAPTAYRVFGFGETVELPEEPHDIWEFADMLEELAGNTEDEEDDEF